MKNRILSVMSLLATAMLLVACAPGQAQATEVGATPSVIAQDDPTEGQASLMNSLKEAGAEVEPGEAIEQAFFGPTGRILKVNGQDVQVFEYPSAEALEAEAAQVSEDGGSVGTSMITWMATPHFFKAGRLLILYVGDDPAVLDLLKGVLGEQFAGR